MASAPNRKADEITAMMAVLVEKPIDGVWALLEQTPKAARVCARRGITPLYLSWENGNQAMVELLFGKQAGNKDRETRKSIDSFAWIWPQRHWPTREPRSNGHAQGGHYYEIMFRIGVSLHI